jgi:hypothetical protein
METVGKDHEIEWGVLERMIESSDRVVCHI